MPTARTRRRSRFTVTFDTGERDVILAYDAPDASLYYTERGHTVRSVRAGDYRQAARDEQLARHKRSLLAAEGHHAGWTVSQADIDKAKAALGIKLPVVIQPTSATGNQSGCYHLRPRAGVFKKDPSKDTACGGMFHHITVKGYLNPLNASRTLWHELTHAAQVERAIARAGAVTERECFDAYIAQTDSQYGVKYEHKSFEREAFASEIRAEGEPLVTPR